MRNPTYQPPASARHTCLSQQRASKQGHSAQANTHLRLSSAPTLHFLKQPLCSTSFPEKWRDPQPSYSQGAQHFQSATWGPIIERRPIKQTTQCTRKSVRHLFMGTCSWGGQCVVVLQRFLSSFVSFMPLRVPRLLGITAVRRPRFCNSCILLAFPLQSPCSLRRIVSVFRSSVRLVALCRRIPIKLRGSNRDAYTCSGPTFKRVFGVGTQASTSNGMGHIVTAICSSLRLVCNSLSLSLGLRAKGNDFGCGGRLRSILLSFVWGDSCTGRSVSPSSFLRQRVPRVSENNQ